MLSDLNDMLNSFGSTLKNVLPTSPFAEYIAMFSNLPYISYLNWFVPVGAAVKVLGTWLAAIALFYIYSIVLRWLKAIS